jgi:hypothetical protein
MAFDLSSAKPLQEEVKPKFDMASAKPMEQPQPAGVPMQGGGRSANAKIGGDDAIVKLKKLVTGEDRKTDLTDKLPELHRSGLLSGESAAKAAAISPALLTATNPDEISQIITKNFPNVAVTYNKDAKGNVFPILTNSENGASTVINKPGMSMFDAMQVLGIGAAYTPAARAPTVLAAGLASGATEAAIQGSQALAGGEFNPEDVVLSAGIGAAGKGVEGVIGSAYRATQGTSKNALVEAGKKAGVPVLTSDVMPPSTFAGKMAQQTAEKIPLAGTAGMRQTQQEMRSAAVDRVAQKYGDFSYKAIVDSLKTRKDRVKQAAGSILQSVGDELDQAGQIPIQNTQNSINTALASLNKPGVLKSDVAIGHLEQMLKTLNEAPQTFTTLKENRTAFREIVNSIDPAVRSQLGSKANSAMNDVLQSMTKDMKQFAAKNLTASKLNSWNKANAVYAEEATLLTRSKLKNVLDKGDVTPESVQTMLFSRKPSEINSLYDSLTQSGRANARSAIISKIFSNLSGRANGVTPNSFVSEMRKFEPQIDVFFKGEEKQALMGLKMVLDATRRAQDAAVTTPTGQQLIGGLSVTGLYLDPVASLGTAGTIGGLSRLYESAPVRNALLRLASVPRGSTRFEKALLEAQSALTTAAQTMRTEVSAEK